MATLATEPKIGIHRSAALLDPVADLDPRFGSGVGVGTTGEGGMTMDWVWA